jgi:hypothetical protein
MADAASKLTERPPPSPQLDDVMLAMDVVDTLRHSDDWVARELDESTREAALMDRLRQIYRDQGIDVPDRVLAEGVRALKESRFVYTPPRPGLATALATAWVQRDLIGKGVLALLAVVAVALGIRYAVVVRPLQEQARALGEAHAAVLAQSPGTAARERADRLLADGRSALDRGDEAAARASLGGLETLRDQLPRQYSLRIVSLASKQVRTALHRRNNYLIVEAVAPDGGLVSLPITSEEDGQTRVVNRWGVRVPDETYIAVERDQRDDGVLQNNRLGEKKLGEPDVAYTMPVLGGAITQW